MRNWIKKLVKAASRIAPSVAPSVDGTVEGPVAPAKSAGLVENLEDRRLFSSSLSYGIVINNINSGVYARNLQMLRDTGTKTVRMWYGVNSYNDRGSGVDKFIHKFHNDGIDVTLTVVPKYAGSYDQVKNYFSWLAGAFGNSVSRFEIGNEVDNRAYWSGSLQSYVNNLLKPAYSALKAHGETVVSGNVSWNPKDIKTMVDAGMLNYCDMVGYHPYRNDVNDLAKCVAEVKSYVRGKPLVASEWNARAVSAGNTGAWAAKAASYWPIIRDNFYAAYYFAATKANTMAGPAGVLNTNGSQNGPFYSMYKNLKYSNASSPVVTVPAPAAGANKPAQTPAPVVKPAPVVAKPAPVVAKPAPAPAPAAGDGPDVLGFDILDGDTGSVLYKNVSSDTTIKLSALAGHKNLKIQAVAETGTESMLVSFGGAANRVENTAAYDLFIKDGKAGNWAVKAGSYQLFADAYTQDNAKGKSGKSKTIKLNFV